MHKDISITHTSRSVVYTCLFGYSEKFLDTVYPQNANIDYICFTDDETLQSDHWKIVHVGKTLLDSHRRSKSFKHRPHAFFAEYDLSLYIDNTVVLKHDPSKLFEDFKENKSAIKVFTHPDRNCVYEEADIVSASRYDDNRIIEAQMEFYRSIGHPVHIGLHALTVILRKHNDRKLIEAMDSWHEQVLRWSKRDQLSFDVVRIFYELDVSHFAGSLYSNDIMTWPYPPDGKRLPRDFDDLEYLRLNPDVALADVHPRKHYLEHGIAEERVYRRPDT